MCIHLCVCVAATFKSNARLLVGLHLCIHRYKKIYVLLLSIYIYIRTFMYTRTYVYMYVYI